MALYLSNLANFHLEANELFSQKGAVRGIKGFEVDLMHILADKFGFNFKLKLESAWGVKLPG